MEFYNVHRPGPLNEHDYYSTREPNDSSVGSPNENEDEIIPTEGLQVFTRIYRWVIHCVRDFIPHLLWFQIDNSSTVLNKIARLYAEKLMNDVCLVVGGKDFLAHRLILCASSEVFHVGEFLFIVDEK